jgi:hypothetical protein
MGPKLCYECEKSILYEKLPRTKARNNLCVDSIVAAAKIKLNSIVFMSASNNAVSLAIERDKWIDES